MKNQILIPVILGLLNSIFTIDAEQACPAAVEEVLDNIRAQFTQNSGNQSYTNLRGELQSKGK